MSDEDKIRLYGSIEAYNISMAKKYLKDTDYVVIKTKEYEMIGKPMDEDYTEIYTKREEARNVLRNLEK